MKKLLFSSLALSLLVFASCEKEDVKKNQFVVVVDDLKGNIPSGDNITLDASKTYILTGALVVESGAVLNIPAGTTIKGNKGFAQYILVDRGGKINAEGTAAKPVRFTSNEATPASGNWGGIIINGYAPISGATTGTTALTEIDNNYVYGGTNVADNSGILKYVIIEYTGAKSSADIEHNGLTLNAVGNGTTIENIYIPHGSDDGIEFFGGSVNVKNLLVVNSDDDMFDATQGWSGTLDNAYGIWLSGFVSTEADPRGIEADGNFDGLGADHVGQSDFVMKNITIVNNSTQMMEDAIKIRRGAKATLTNVLVKNGTTKDVLDLTDGKGAGNAASSGSVTATNVTFTGKEINGTSAITVGGSNTGATTSVFAWTGFSF